MRYNLDMNTTATKLTAAQAKMLESIKAFERNEIPALPRAVWSKHNVRESLLAMGILAYAPVTITVEPKGCQGYVGTQSQRLYVVV